MDAAVAVGTGEVAPDAVPYETSGVKVPTAVEIWFAWITAAEPATGPPTTPAPVEMFGAWVAPLVPL